MGAAALEHNQPLRFDWSPIRDSTGATFRLSLDSDGEHGIGFWATDREAYSEGALFEAGKAGIGDLHLVTYYDYRLSQALGDIARGAWAQSRRVPALVALLLLPGALLSLLLLGNDRMDPGTWLALAVGLSLAFWPLLLLWCAVAGVSLGPVSAWASVAVILAALVFVVGRRHRAAFVACAESQDGWAPLAALAGVLLLAAAARMLQARGLFVPPWVDSVHHTVVTAAVAEQGNVPFSLEPYVRVSNFHYHFGFHVNAAVLSWLAALSPTESVLLLGQVLNAMAALMVYALAQVWTGRRWAGVGAALVVSALSYMPAYYLSWGRYTQLAGLCLLPAAIIATWWLWRAPTLTLGRLAAAGVVVSGLTLTHYRVSLFYALFVCSYGVLTWWRSRRRGDSFLELPRRSALLLLLVVALALPLVSRFAARVLPKVVSMYGGWSALEGVDTSFPAALLDVGRTRFLLYFAAAGVVWAGIRRKWEILVLPVWSALCFLPANLHLVGLPDTWLIHNQAVVISFWLPVSVAIGWFVGDLAELAQRVTVWWVKRKKVRAGDPPTAMVSRHAIGWALFVAAMALGGWGLWHTVDVVNPVTVLVTREDESAIEWVRDNTPADSLFLINTRRWQGELRAGTDAGWWLPMQAGRRVSLPCVLYAQGDLVYVQEVNDLARAVEEAPSVDDPALLGRLQEAGITHVFSGANGGRLMPKDLDPSPHYRLVHTSGRARVYEFVPGGEP